MGVNWKHYVVVGIDIGFDADHETQYEKFEDIMDPDCGEFGCIFDGMNGDYVILGKVLDVVGEYDGLELNKLSLSTFNKVSKEVKNHLKKLGYSEVEPEFMAFTHFR